MSVAPAFRIVEIEFHERPVRLRLPFRFGVLTLSAAPQVFARARIRLADGREGWGAAAEMLIPKWFDKNPDLSNEDNLDQLRRSLWLAREKYLAATPRTAFGHFAAHYREQLTEGETAGLNALVASFGPALIDRAVLDALCRLSGESFFSAMGKNLPGLDPAALLPEFRDFDMDRFLAALHPRRSIHARHTVGLVDPIDGHPRQVDDGLPESLHEVIETYGHRWFKLKVGGDLGADLARLREIAAVLERHGRDYRVTLDGNEQYPDLDGLLALWEGMRADPALTRFCEAIVFIEQPIHRQQALAQAVDGVQGLPPLLIDESDGDLDAFPRARALGYRGVSSKSCKGFYKSLINAARCQRWWTPARAYFLSGEDLTTQAGLAVQQDLALVALLGLGHVERNGHHYVNGMADLPETEQAAFLAAHGDLYERRQGAARLRIRDGQLALDSLYGAGFASGAGPDWEHCAPMPTV